MAEKEVAELGAVESVVDETKDVDGSFKDYLAILPRIFRYADKLSRCLYGVAFAASIASGAALPLETIVFGGSVTKFNGFGSGGSSSEVFREEVNNYVLWFVYLFIAKFFLQYIAGVTISIAAIRTTRSLRQAFLEHTLRQEIWQFDKQSNGAIATQVTTNGGRINQGIAEKLMITITALSTFFSSFIVALSIQWKLALITMSIVPVIFIATGVLISMDAVVEAKVTRHYSRGANLAQETISSIRTVKAFWAHEKMARKYDEYLSLAHKEGNKKSAIYAILFSTEYFCVFSAVALAFWQGYRMFQSGEVSSAGPVITVVLAVTIAATSVSSIAPQITAFTNAASAATELFSVMDRPSLLDPLDPSGLQPEKCDGQIELENIVFAYPSRPSAPVLRDFSVSIPAGKRTALVGASGCGKSTLVGLLERWYQSSSGSVRLDGIDISKYNTQWLRSRIRLVQQEPVLFRGTVFENVAKGFVDSQLHLSREKQLELVHEACKASNAHDFVQELPHGYDTEVGERAGMLSGGQRQRISIARSIISDPKILLLDEATSALDPKAEKIVQDALNRVSVNRTTLMIAHRLATVKSADSIAVMQSGRLIEQGTHNELIAKKGHYAALVAAQDLGHEQADDPEKELEGENEFEPPNRQMSLQRTKTGTGVGSDGEAELEQLGRGTLNYSLLRCVLLMLFEQRELYPHFFISTIACLIGGATYPGQALLYGRVLDVFQSRDQAARDKADFYALMFFVIALGNLVAYAIVGWVCNTVGQTVTHKYRLEMFRRVLSQDISFFDKKENASGALTSNLSVLPTQLQELISANVMLIFIVLVNVISSSVLALAYGWKLALVVIFGGLPPLIGSGYMRIRIETAIEAINGERFAESASLASEAVTSIKTVASLTLEKQILKQYADLLSGIVIRSARSLIWTMFWYSLSQSLDFLVQALGFWYGSKLLASGEYTTQAFYVIFIGVLFAGQAAGQVSGQAYYQIYNAPSLPFSQKFFGYSTSLTKAVGAANYILWLRTLKPTITENELNKHNGPDGDGPVDFEHLEFAYPQREASRVLRGVTMTIEPGQYAAYVGPSGCGKSTLMSLLERFYDPTSGRICLGNQDITNLSPRLYRNHMSLVQQEPTLYQGSVRENIALGLETEPSDDQIKEACRQANALEFIVSLPEGLETPCGSRGLQFSGGQRQRIAIARALIRNPRLLLLDEATSALDTQSERLVQATLDEAATTRTTIAVAHRLSTIRNADIIFVFASGKVVETGTHEQLQRQRGRYYEMCLAQSLDQA